MKLHEALAATFAAVGNEMSDTALALIVRDLEPYPIRDVFAALQRCRKELRHIALVDILDRIPGGHPGPEEAWSIVAKCLNDERVTVVWTEEIKQAFLGAALPLQDDPIAARMAFKEVYPRLTSESRAARKKIEWQISLGHDKNGREAPLLEAIEKGRISRDVAAKFLPYLGEIHRDVASIVKKLRKEP